MADIFLNPQIPAPIRTLAWSIQSASLVDTSAFGDMVSDNNGLTSANGITQDLDSWLINNSGALKQLQEWMDNCHSRRLGHQFEHYWHFYWEFLSSQRNNSEWLFNQQINANGITLGETDALRYDPDSGELHHFELAVKFYLGYQDAQASALWLGPNCKDRLDLKLQQMCEKQLTLLERHPDAIPTDWQVSSLHKHMLIKGWLFYPIDTKLAPPRYAGNHHHRGHWLRLAQSDYFREQSHWVILDRSEWLGWFIASEDQLRQKQRLLSKPQLLQQLKTTVGINNQPLMLVRCIEHSPDNHYLQEAERLVVVPNNWPSSFR